MITVISNPVTTEAKKKKQSSLVGRERTNSVVRTFSSFSGLAARFLFCHLRFDPQNKTRATNESHKPHKNSEWGKTKSKQQGEEKKRTQTQK